MVARPSILVQCADPTVRGMRKHFEKVLQRYGAPLICLNLIRCVINQPCVDVLTIFHAYDRQSESVMRETRLGPPFHNGVCFLNSLLNDPLPPVEYIPWDFKRVSK